MEIGLIWSDMLSLIKSAQVYFSLSLGLFGAVMGSFLSCMVCRRENPIRLSDRSACDSCGKQLRWYELIPILSYVIQAGKCRKCGAHIPLRFFISEVLGAITGFGFGIFGFKFGILSILLYVSAIYDMEWKEVPRGLSVGTFIYALVISLILPIQAIFSKKDLWLVGLELSGVINGLIVFGILYIVYQIKEDAIGGADIWALSACCMQIPLTLIPIFFIACSLPALISIGAIRAIQNKRGNGDRLDGVVFLPFIYLGFLITLCVAAFGVMISVSYLPDQL